MVHGHLSHRKLILIWKCNNLFNQYANLKNGNCNKKNLLPQLIVEDGKHIKVHYVTVKLEGGCQAHRVGYFGSAMICKKLLPEIESK